MGVVAGAAAAGVDVAGAGDGRVGFGYLVGGAAVHCVSVVVVVVVVWVATYSCR